MANTETTEKQLNCKCVLVGDNGIGKTSLLTAYFEKRFTSEYIPSVYEQGPAAVVECEGKQIALTLVDIYEDPNYKRLRPLHYPNTNVFLLCFNIQNKYNGAYDNNSFARIEEMWHPEITHHCPGVPVLLIGLKHDLKPLFLSQQANKLICGYFRACNKDKNDNYIPIDILKVIESFLQHQYDDKNDNEFVSDEDAQKYCDKIGGYKYMTCSSLEMKGVNEIFNEVCKCYLKFLREPKPRRQYCDIL